MIRYYVYPDEIAGVYYWVVGPADGDCDDPLMGPREESLSEVLSFLALNGVARDEIHVDD